MFVVCGRSLSHGPIAPGGRVYRGRRRFVSCARVDCVFGAADQGRIEARGRGIRRARRARRVVVRLARSPRTRARREKTCRCCGSDRRVSVHVLHRPFARAERVRHLRAARVRRPRARAPGRFTGRTRRRDLSRDEPRDPPRRHDGRFRRSPVRQPHEDDHGAARSDDPQALCKAHRGRVVGRGTVRLVSPFARRRARARESPR